MNETPTASWEVRISAYGVKHVLPLDDLREHEAEDCWCHPSDDEGIIIHNSQDGREAYERGDRKLT